MNKANPRTASSSSCVSRRGDETIRFYGAINRLGPRLLNRRPLHYRQTPSGHSPAFPLIFNISYEIDQRILKILKHRSASGISATTFELEVVAATIGLGYSIQKGIPFSAYGEVFFILIQGLILVAITYYYSQPVGTATWIRALLHSSISHFYLPGSLKYGRTLKRQMELSNLENDPEIAAADPCS
ncbi:Mannose-P-dolichol utilization defect 1 protein-like [Citrus sinensis]|uniref:Mannose-P-dolichol utilization defect 1 protein-like n=1 Tax=Citrus sinensis TaxID=2711 RepID=A0ACB8KUL6_CITSI|nr:Mannose-P-dolichol utilization defect 1 protein-like [Citrus sinensis]